MTATTAIRTDRGAPDATAAEINGAILRAPVAHRRDPGGGLLRPRLHQPRERPRRRRLGDSLVSSYHGDRTRVLVAAVVTGFAVLNLMWFAAAIRTTLTNAGQDGWGAAATAASASFGGIFLVVTTLGAALALSNADAGTTS